MSFLKENLMQIHENIGTAAKKSGRKAEDITLIAVTKTIEPNRIEALINLGVSELGENKVQELLTKHGIFHPEPSWHLIGHLQTNKVKYVIDKVKLIQSVDSIRLAEEINKRARQMQKRMDILVEINIAGETTKYGVKPAETAHFFEHLCNFSNIRIVGLMCIAPFAKKPDENRIYFEKMLKLYVDMQEKFPHNTDIKNLSAGMSNDYMEAIEEGANMVRIGTALFGERAGQPGRLPDGTV